MNRTHVLLIAVLSGGLVGGCSSGAHSTASRPLELRALASTIPSPDLSYSTATSRLPEPNPPISLAQGTCWDTVSCCVQRNPLTAVESCGADPARVADILKTFESLYATAHPGAKAAAEADVAGVEPTEDWSSIAELPEWKQQCIKFYNACKNNGWTGKCDDCLRYCEGQRDWPLRTCRPRKE